MSKNVILCQEVKILKSEMLDKLKNLEKSTISLIIAVGIAVVGFLGFFIMNNLPDDESADIYSVKSQNDGSVIYVHVKGAVKNPGLYEFTYGDRVNDAIEKAGGALNTADVDKLNLAKLLTDEMEVVVAEKGDNTEDDDKININTADVKRLCDIPGVGEATAERIVKYRETNGSFSTIEEIMNIEGIGLKSFESMVDYISIY